MKLDIHLVSWNRPKMTRLVIETLHKNTQRENFRLVVLDNASDEATVEMLQNMHDNGLIDEFIPIKTNLGLEAARNLMLNNCTQSDYFVCLDNDCLAPKPLKGKDWTDSMLQLIADNEDFAAISMRTQVMIGTGNIFEEADEKKLDLVEFPHPGGSFRIMDTKLAHFVGGWSREMPGRGQEERYICGKLWDAGFKTAFAAQIETLHLFGTREDKDPTDRWGYDPIMRPEETGHSDIDHPALRQGDDPAEVNKYAGAKLTRDYFHD